MYSINGRSLNEGHSGWHILFDGTNTQGGVTRTVNKTPVPGRPGYRPAPSTFTEQMVIFNVRTPRARLDELLALCDAASILTRTDDPTKEAYVELLSAIPAPSGNTFDSWFDVTVTLSIYQGVWRDVDAEIVGPISITTPSQTITMLDDLAAPVYDEDLFLRGVFGEFTLTDSGGSWLKTVQAWPGSSSTGLLWIGATQQAFLANESSPWVPVSDASDYVDVSGNGGFRLTPKMVSGNPANRRVELQLVTLTQTSTTLRVRAKRAYRMN